MNTIHIRAPQDIHWLAGLLEGECWLGYTGRNGPTIELEMTDLDVVTRVSDLWHRAVSHRKARSEKWSDTYRTKISGREAIGWMMTILPHMGQRRAARIREIIAQWKAH